MDSTQPGQSDPPRVNANQPEMTTGDEHDLYNRLTQLNNELANAQRQLIKSNLELEHLNAEKTRFLGMAAHDLRTPIGAIQIYSQFLLEEACDVLSPEQVEFIGAIRDSSRFMLRLINDLLDLSTIESGNLKLDLGTADLHELLTRNIGLNRVLAAQKQVRIEIHESGVACVIAVDRIKFDQVLNNLLSNAIKFSPPGATITVQTQVSQSEAVVRVVDHGPGIPADELQNLFRPFHRTSVTATSTEPSTGLGLAITKRIVEGHGGRVWVESKVGQGSTFSFALPLLQAGGGTPAGK